MRGQQAVQWQAAKSRLQWQAAGSMLDLASTHNHFKPLTNGTRPVPSIKQGPRVQQGGHVQQSLVINTGHASQSQH